MKLKTKTILITASVLLLVFCSVAALNLYHIGTVETMLETSVNREGQSLIFATSEALSITLPSRDYSLVEAYGRELVAKRTNIASLGIFDEDGEAIFSYACDAENLDPDLMRELKERKGEISKSLNGYEGFWAPLLFTDLSNNEKVIYGFVTIRLNKAYIQAQMKALMIKLLVLFIVIMIFSSIVFYLFSNGHIVKPIVRLAEITRELSAGNLNYTIPCNSNDEISDLTCSFNTMLENLNQTTTSIDHLNKEISERKEVERKLRESEEKYRIQFEGALDAIFLANCETGILVDCNKAALDLVGREKAEIIGRHQKILHPPISTEEPVTDTFEEQRKQGNGEVLETKVITKNGEVRDVAIKGSVLEIGGEMVLQGIFRDITENKKKEKKFRQMQDELMDASRRAGMAEVATDILHNVGNVLNSVNVSTTLIHETVANSEILNLKKVADMIESHLQDLEDFLSRDPKGRYVPSYLIKVAELLSNEQETMIGRLVSLVEDVNHIKSIVKMQQEYAKVSSLETSVSIDQVIDDAIRINETSLTRYSIRIERECDPIGEVILDKQRVVQILVNLISNAKQAMVPDDRVDKILKIRCYRHNEKVLRIEVTDNGMGISSENLTKIFQHGFTTKKDGHGFGLHSGALVAKEMKGSLTAHSEGVGHGATFTLELPFKPTGVKQ